MDTKIHKIENIHVEAPRRDILARLKFNFHKTKLDRKTLDLFEKTLSLAVSVCECKGVYRFLDIKKITDKKIVLSDGTAFESASLAKLLRNSSKVVMMASTVGKEITDETNSLIAKGRASEAVIVDAAASEIADEVMNQINLFCANIAKKDGMKLTKMRFSPGYGDLGVENQKQFFKTLELKKSGFSLMESFMIVPEKSVTAIAGVE
ncbi:MAG TPA: methionine synthase [Lentisphaeria bacterium]|nr:MAG: hypothetical protein A2X48_07670 [Lentisphaerae bacterium GWF2_49_21]HBC86323.1 methionine synthase [Lentisphaeria bacterium]